jgi:hypothetical protein
MPLTRSYHKQPDGGWIDYQAKGVVEGTSLAPGTLEALSAKVLADAAAGKTMRAPELSFQHQALADLVPGAKTVFAPSPTPIPLKDKRVAIVLSTRAISELERFKRERAALITASARLSGEAAKYRATFTSASNPDRMLVNVAKTARKHIKSVQSSEDLIDLHEGKFDYALIIDWSYKTRFDLLGKYDNFTDKLGIAPACESMSLFLVSPELKVINQFHSLPSCADKLEHKEKGDAGYLHKLSLGYEWLWGKGLDQTGALMAGLDYFLKH